MTQDLALPEGLAPEFQALCAAVGRSVGTTVSVEKLRDALERVGDWDAFVRGARSHRVATMVLPVLRGVGPATVPSGVLSRLERRTAENARSALVQLGELTRLQKLFDQAAVPVILLKGVVLSQRLYGQPAMRGVGDLDFLISPADLAAAHGLLIGAGYAAQGELDGLRHAKDMIYRHPGGHVVELHVHLLENRAVYDPAFADLWGERRSVDLAGIQVMVLPAVAELLYLVAHGANHGWNRLCWLADVAVMCRDDDLRDQAMRQARQNGMDLIFRHALCLVGLCLDGAIPAEFAADRALCRRVRWFVRASYCGRQWLGNVFPRGSLGWLLARSRERLWQLLQGGRWAHCRGALAAAWFNPVDRSVFHLPHWLEWAYPLLRPVGWLIRNFSRRASRW